MKPSEVEIEQRQVWQRQREVLRRAKRRFLDLSVPAGGSPLDVQEAFSRAEVYMHLLYGPRPRRTVTTISQFPVGSQEKTELVASYGHDVVRGRPATKRSSNVPLARMPLPEHLLRLVDGEVCCTPSDTTTRPAGDGWSPDYAFINFCESIAVSRAHCYSRSQLQLLEELIEEFPPLEVSEETGHTLP
ncbi:hypothetical protein CSUI_007831 [Cystoisospora suis]|uniref:Uncharacterized protein n=1 Tax=Cystoisospora suis TaxID=483139 RepID=A0A2C6KPD7_9APIC|nr:hypothetical protein CSUI_007831 [Cystoisospora suis]